MPSEKEEKATKKAKNVEKKNINNKTTKKDNQTSNKKTNNNAKKTVTNNKKTTNTNNNKKSNTNKENKTAKKIENKEKSKDKKEIQTVDIQEIEKTVKEEQKAKKSIPKEEQKKMNGEVFTNIVIAIGIVVFLNFIILGFINIESEVFMVDLKVFALSILAVAIGIFEYAYKKDSDKIALYGIETLVFAICMLGFIYLYIMQNSKFVIITILITYIVAIYYTVKSLIIYKKMKKQYIIDSIKKEIVKK